MLKMLTLIHVLAFLALFNSITFVSGQQNSKYNHFDRKTPYRNAANYDYDKLEYEGCQQKKIWVMARHGTRTPEDEEIVVINSRLPALQSAILASPHKLTREDRKLLEAWIPPDFGAGGGNELTEEGQDEHRLLAQRIQARFSDIVPLVWANDTVYLKYTDSHRTRDSCKKFAIGLFGKDEEASVWYPTPVKEDPILRFYKLCQKWNDEVKNDTSSWVEYNAFITSSIMTSTIRAVESRLGLPANSLSFLDLNLMYTQCAFESAWDRAVWSPWCPVFSLDDILVMEYAEDLNHYWIDGYGLELNYKQACPAFKDMVDFMTNGNDKNSSVFYFTHSGSVIKLTALVGLKRDETPLTAAQINPDRLWKGSEIGPFANNIAFISYDCAGEAKLLVTLQEKIERFPCCPDTDLCPLSVIQQYYSDDILCRFDEICGNV